MTTPDRPQTNPHCTAPRHGTESAYSRAGCRCPEAREERRLRCKRRRHRRHESTLIDGTGVARRVQALMVLGWPSRELATRIRCPSTHVRRLADRYHPTVHVDTAARVAAAYRALVDRAGPSPISARRARAKGWHPPVAWGADIDDPAAVPYAGLDPGIAERSADANLDIELVVAGKAPFRTLVTRKGKAEAVARMLEAGQSKQGIGRTHGLSWATIASHLAYAEQLHDRARETVAA